MKSRQQMILIFAIVLLAMGYATYVVWDAKHLPPPLRNQKTNAVPAFERVKPEDRRH
jgi:hypothetical protein